MAVNENVNKVVYGNQTLIDLTGDTVTAGALASGYTAHDRSGAVVNGTLELPSSSNPLPVEKGGTNANTAAGARSNLDVYSKSEVTNAIAQSTANVVDTSTTLSELRNGMNAIKVASGTVIGNYTVPNNMRGYAVKDGSTAVGFLASYNGENVAVVGNNNLNHWVFINNLTISEI